MKTKKIKDTIYILKKIKTKNTICNACESKNVKPKHRMTCLGGRQKWKTVAYYIPTLYCEDCGLNIGQREEEIIRKEAVRIASS